MQPFEPFFFEGLVTLTDIAPCLSFKQRLFIQ